MNKNVLVQMYIMVMCIQNFHICFVTGIISSLITTLIHTMEQYFYHIIFFSLKF